MTTQAMRAILLAKATAATFGQAYLAETAVGRNLNDKDRVKVVCVRPEKMDEMTAQFPSE